METGVGKSAGNKKSLLKGSLQQGIYVNGFLSNGFLVCGFYVSYMGTVKVFMSSSINYVSMCNVKVYRKVAD